MNRRLFLRFLAIVPIFLSRPTRWLRPSAEAGHLALSHAKACLSHVLTDESGARVIGTAYLSAYPAERDAISLLRHLLGPATLQGPDDLRRRIAMRRQQDFVQGDIVLVDGWILAKSEARAAALPVLL